MNVIFIYTRRGKYIYFRHDNTLYGPCRGSEVPELKVKRSV